MEPLFQDLEVLWLESRWQVRNLGEPAGVPPLGRHRLKWVATFAARAVARDRVAHGALAVELYLRAKDGQLRSRDTFGHDPRSPG